MTEFMTGILGLLGVGFISALAGVFFAAQRLLAAWATEQNLREQNARLGERITVTRETASLREAHQAQRHELDKEIQALKYRLQTQENLDYRVKQLIAEATAPKIGQYPEKF